MNGDGAGRFSLSNFKSIAGLVFVIVLAALLGQFGMTWSFGGHVQL